MFARWGNGDSTAVGIVGRALGGSCECSIPNPDNPNDPNDSLLDDACLNNCIRHATRAGNVRVLNLSYGGTVPVPVDNNEVNQEREVIRAFCNRGGIVVVAAGNDGVDIIRPDARDTPTSYAQDLAGAHVCVA
jgi:subtilisin family serine protease